MSNYTIELKGIEKEQYIKEHFKKQKVEVEKDE